MAQLGARALRKLGIAIVADSARPASGPTVTANDVAAAVLLQLGIPVAESDRPAAAGTITQAEIASRALRAVGINPAPSGSGTATGITYTAAALATSALLKLAVIAADETPSALDQAEALARVNDVHDSLAALDYVTWTAAAIPAAVAEFYIVMAANLLAPQFGKPADMQAYAGGQTMIKVLALTGAPGQALALAKVAEVHEQLNAAGLVAWAIAAIPLAQAEPYVALTASLLAPVFGYQQDAPGRQLDKALADAARETIRRAAVIQGAQARALNKVQAALDEVNAFGLITWDASAIPSYAVDSLSALAAEKMGPEFGKPDDPKAVEAAEGRLRRAAMGGPAGQALAEQKVRAVHYSLEARGRVRWTLFDIPVWAEEDIVFMAAVLLAPECGVKADPGWWQAAEMDLMRIVSLPSDREPVRAVYF